MRSGLLNERLKVYTVTPVTDLNGAKTTTLTLKGTYFCRVVTHRRQLGTDTDRYMYANQTTFELRRQISIAKNDIIEYNSTKYVISSIEVNKNLDLQTINCELYEQ